MDKCYGVAPSTSIRHKPPENLWLLAGLRRVPLDRDVPGCRTKHEDRAASVDLEARRRDLTDYDPGIGPRVESRRENVSGDWLRDGALRVPQGHLFLGAAASQFKLASGHLPGVAGRPGPVVVLRLDASAVRRDLVVPDLLPALGGEEARYSSNATSFEHEKSPTRPLWRVVARSFPLFRREGVHRLVLPARGRL